MARPVYPHELSDPDFAWLLSTFRENNPEYLPIESSCLAFVFIKITDKEYHMAMVPPEVPVKAEISEGKE